ncbi:hypothetical protein RRG08_056322 [Elysia crispata]|uniref:EGF-like domain-containing protein n=1 Tax=Elysia crispata TaxID=231223 RepID=A0AAE0YPT4_9GAST|nr:hypothetical protein RRG08_056322 [Elysia crispata]
MKELLSVYFLKDWCIARAIGLRMPPKTACTCLHGLCNDGPDGDGLCRKNTCQPGYISENCDRKVMACGPRTVTCHAHAFCYVGHDNIYRCKCNPGYEGDGEDCLELDPCEQKMNGGCHQQATCIKLTPTMLKCECNTGWVGDGTFCSPRSPCYEGCHENATCLNIDSEFHCVCDVGFSGNGTWCETDNVCLENNGGCDPKAYCSPLKPGLAFGENRTCQCPPDMSGDGSVCHGTIAEQVMAHPNLTRLASLIKFFNSLPCPCHTPLFPVVLTAVMPTLSIMFPSHHLQADHIIDTTTVFHHIQLRANPVDRDRLATTLRRPLHQCQYEPGPSRAAIEERKIVESLGHWIDNKKKIILSKTSTFMLEMKSSITGLILGRHLRRRDLGNRKFSESFGEAMLGGANQKGQSYVNSLVYIQIARRSASNPCCNLALGVPELDPGWPPIGAMLQDCMILNWRDER